MRNDGNFAGLAVNFIALQEGLYQPTQCRINQGACRCQLAFLIDAENQAKRLEVFDLFGFNVVVHSKLCLSMWVPWRLNVSRQCLAPN